MIALAPSLREEVAPGADEQSASWTLRLGRWWTGGRRCLGYLFGGFVPLLAIVGAVVYLLFVEQKLFGVEHALDWLGEHGDVLVRVGQWLAGGAVTITALGARFTETFGKLRVALDAALDVDNYFQDPADNLPPRARIFSRYASLLADVCKRGYSRVVIVSHSQGTVISADLLHYLAVTRRLRDYVGTTPLSLVTVGSPLRDLYAALFPFLYRWMGAQPTSFASRPDPADLQVTQWVNAYRAGDYVGRAIWTAPERARDVPRRDGVGRWERSGVGETADRAEFCLGAGAHTHYFSNDAIALGGGDRSTRERRTTDIGVEAMALATIDIGQCRKVGLGVKRPEDVVVARDGTVWMSDQRSACARVLRRRHAAARRRGRRCAERHQHGSRGSHRHRELRRTRRRLRSAAAARSVDG